jgi:hypothetical protein
MGRPLESEMIAFIAFSKVSNIVVECPLAYMSCYCVAFKIDYGKKGLSWPNKLCQGKYPLLHRILLSDRYLHISLLVNVQIICKHIWWSIYMEKRCILVSIVILLFFLHCSLHFLFLSSLWHLSNTSINQASGNFNRLHRCNILDVYSFFGEIIIVPGSYC